MVTVQAKYGENSKYFDLKVRQGGVRRQRRAAPSQ
jgi:hypothetical protein